MGDVFMKADKIKIELAMARACITPAELSKKAQMPRPSVNNVLSGKRNVRPATLGRIAVALGVDVLEIIESGDVFVVGDAGASLSVKT
jgi:transcriptional regulator with XRE-family HTH domain